ncbi:type VI secretion protein, family [Thiorhodovibrio winogradskyi]|uniref:Type VI secretion protein, family n=1 Tax=Thiorhodovibrio winogradskyi TaxID=77007 RepID=A0ABZ0S8K2_9GAMM|nr:type VI secretion system contractile sheath small subunit [Thiorhodovibrio winogradskyi]
MPTEGSVAPKERVNIVYRPATGDAKEEVELPLKLLVLGDFTQQADDRMLEDRDPVSIDKDTFDDVLRGQNLNLKLNVPNKLSGEEDAQMAVELDFTSMSDFAPDAIVRKIPELAKLMELRDALKALKGPLANVPEFRKKVQELVKDEGVRERLMKELGIES